MLLRFPLQNPAFYKQFDKLASSTMTGELQNTIVTISQCFCTTLADILTTTISMKLSTWTTCSGASSIEHSSALQTIRSQTCNTPTSFIWCIWHLHIKLGEVPLTNLRPLRTSFLAFWVNSTRLLIEGDQSDKLIRIGLQTSRIHHILKYFEE